MIRIKSPRVLTLLLFLVFFCTASGLNASENPAGLSAGSTSAVPWWGWSLILFVFCFFLGLVAVVAGIGGGILYVPIVGALFPFHLDFVRGAGLLVAMAGALSAAPRLLRSGMASLRLAIPLALASSVGALIGANVGLALPETAVSISLGLVILGVVLLMVFARRSDYPDVATPDSLAVRMQIPGSFLDESIGETVTWTICRLKWGLLIFLFIGFVAGMFGLGAGWANVPALNLLMGAPLKVSVATSLLIIAVNGSAASWVYLNQGAVLPAIAVPSVAGMMLGSRLGARLLGRTKPKIIRWVVIGLLALAGLRSIISGTGLGG